MPAIECYYHVMTGGDFRFWIVWVWAGSRGRCCRKYVDIGRDMFRNGFSLVFDLIFAVNKIIIAGIIIR